MAGDCIRLGLSRDFLTSDGVRSFDELAWRRLITQPGVEMEFLPQPAAAPIAREDVCRFDVLLIKRNPMDAARH